MIEIGTAPQAIPAERLNVRVVGVRFLPPVDEALDLKSPRAAGSGLVASIEDASVWMLKAASSGLFAEANAAQTVASLETEASAATE